MLESVTFADAFLCKIRADLREIFSHELSAAIPSLRTIAFGSDVHHVSHATLATASATLQTVCETPDKWSRSVPGSAVSMEDVQDLKDEMASLIRVTPGLL